MITHKENCAPTNCSLALPFAPYSEGCTTPKVRLELTPGLPIQEWMAIGKQLSEGIRAGMWMLGDWLVYGHNNYEVTEWNNRIPKGIYAEIAKVTGYAEGTLRNAKYVCAAIP